MPTKSPTDRTGSRVHRSRAESAVVDWVKPSGLYQAATVQDRISQWQEHGAGSAPPPDAVSIVSAPDSEASVAPAIAPSELSHIDDNVNTQRESGRWNSANRDHARRVRSSSTPRKRVISDEHWRSNRTTRHGRRPSPQPAETPDQRSDHNEEGLRCPQSEPLKSTGPRSSHNARAEREERRRRRLESRSRKAEGLKQATDRGHSPSSLRELPRGHVRIESEVFQTVGSDDLWAGSAHVSPQHSRSPSQTGSDVQPSQLDCGPWKKSRYAEALGQPPPLYPPEVPIKSKKGSFLNKTKERFGLSDPVTLVSNRLPSIEAWLFDQPDPFNDVERDDNDNGQQTVKAETQPPKPPKQPKKRSVKWEIPDENSLPDPNQIWNAIGTSTNRDGTVDHGAPLPDTRKDSSHPGSTSPSALKRRTVRASRPKRHTVAHVSPDELQPLNKDNDMDWKMPPIVPPIQESEEVDPVDRLKQLPTVASVERLGNVPPTYEDSIAPESCGLKRKLTTHEDMMSVLSMPTSRRNTRRKRSVKVDKLGQDVDAVSRVLKDMADEEAKYSRDLKTLVDGVIPVLLQCVLSKTDAVAAASMFTRSADANNDLSFTRPIIDMGIALERIKTLHNRIPLHSVDSLFSWCQTAHKAYSEYLKAWRLGFQDIVIDLAPLEEPGTNDNEDMAGTEKGDNFNANRNTADVAYLMKRPLVQIRKLGKGLNDLKDLMPKHPVGCKIAEDYDELTAAAKNKHQQEKARLEDEAAAYIDATKCRDIKTMAPLPGVTIDKNRRVRARDCFNSTLYHSSGQRMDCRIELILRDNHHASPDGGDLLICQVEPAGKWLLFAPADISLVSARKGEQGCDLVVMVRGRVGISKEWYELLALQAEDPEAAAEWMMMLSSNPLPPKLSRVPSFVDHKAERQYGTAPATIKSDKHTLERVSSIESVDLPIGEPSILGSVAPSGNDKKNQGTSPSAQKTQPKLSLGGGLSKKPVPEHWKNQAFTAPSQPFAPSLQSSDKSTISGWSAASSTKFAPSSLAPAYFSHVSSEQPEHHEPRHSKHVSLPATRASSSPTTQSLPVSRADDKDSSVQNEASSTGVTKQSKGSVEPLVAPEQATPVRPPVIRAPSSAPSQELPSISKARHAVSRDSTGSTPLTESIRDTWATISGLGRKVVSQPSTPTTKREYHANSPTKEIKATPLQPGLRTTVPSADVKAGDVDNEVGDDNAAASSPPPPPRHKEIPVLSPRSRNVPVLRPSAAQQKTDRANGRLSSSPLRNEYAPSAPSASASEDDKSQTSPSDGEDSQTSEDFESELFDIAMPLVSPYEKRHSTGGAFAKAPSVPTTGTRTLAPSDSASQGPYRRVPSSAERPDVVKKRASAMVCSWSDNGQWAPIRNDFCLIVVSPGLIEAFPMDDPHRRTTDRVVDPLVAFELTPIVPLRRPTGLDISIRSPPTANSQIKTTSNIMFRSHSVAECDQLYQMINWARCNNLTYIELERSRPRPQPAVTFSDQQAPRPRSWFSLGGGIRRRNSYRVGNVPPSSMGESQMTSNTVSSAMSALKRLSISSAFSIKRSSVIRRPGFTTSASLYSSSNETGSGSGASTPPISQIGAIPSKDGPNVPSTSAAAVNGGGMVHNMKIKLLVRRGRDWQALGVSRLSVLPGVNRSNETPETSRPGSPGQNAPSTAEPSRRMSAPPGSVAAEQRQYRLPSANFTPHRLHGNGREKRIVITANGKPDEVMLDVTLGESCFEKVAHLGIAMQVWTEDQDVRSRGGVVPGQNTMYMLQFYKQQDCAWVFGLVGSYRYGNALSAQEN